MYQTFILQMNNILSIKEGVGFYGCNPYPFQVIFAQKNKRTTYCTRPFGKKNNYLAG